MSPDGSLQTIGSHTDTLSSTWHSIRPWSPILSLAVREITSVSATFILSSNLDETDPSLASLGLEAAEEGPEQDEDNQSRETKESFIIADLLSKGLSVNVNGSAWPRAFIRIDDQVDEAVIIIYALMPGRQYDIELGLAHAGQSSTLRRQVTTEADSDDDSAEINTDPESPILDNHSASASSSSDPHSTPSTSPSRTVPGTPPNAAPAAPPITLEDHLGQLQHTLSMVNTERDGLITSLKAARRDAQKADAALRAEIDTLKRTFEKNGAAELRGKQKLLALQEAAKRAQNATKETEADAKEVETEIPELKAKREAKEGEHRRIKTEADRVRREREELEEKARKRLESMKAELTGLTNKLERLNGKSEKMESTVIPDMEEKLKEVAKEIEEEQEELFNLELEERTRVQLEETYLPFQRTRHNSAGPIGRPNPAPIQRPQGESNSIWSPIQAHRQPQVPLTHTPRSQSFHNQAPSKHALDHSPSPPVVLMNPQRRTSLNSGSSPTSGPSAPTSTSSTAASTFSFATSTSNTTTSSPKSSSTSSPTRTSTSAVAVASTLSSRAPAFEPSRPIGGLKINAGVNGSNPCGISTAAVPAQRPTASASSAAAGTVGAGRPSRSGSHGQRSVQHGLGYVR